ncbi:site-specific DNA-methyltransferase [Streptococcus ruminantium]|uniref:site-specific DNA-methyltransferase n=1 Tax=Streptococcus ruminantium TaxID=1917441 RepID=UPI0012DC0B6C|nr:site-specific DNA-methyltransferase [Streptococcus ruminantium]
MSQEFIERPRKNEKEGAIAYVRELLKQAQADRRDEDAGKLEDILHLLNTKKYGLVWEEHAELVEEEMKTKIPVFVEDESKKIMGNPDSEDYNFLLEGDNLHSLHLLKKTHAGAIDVIYIDPPYNTGNKDFIYNDKIVDKTDGYSHSKWLSFMSKRLEIARELLSEVGVIFISIDDNEQAQLKLLCDEIFGEENVEINIWSLIDKSESTFEKTAGYTTRKEHEYLITIRKNTTTKFKKYKDIIDFSSSSFSNPDNDPRGDWFSGNISRTGIKTTTGSKYYTIITPTGVEYSRNWTLSKEEFENAMKENRIYFPKNGGGVPRYKIFATDTKETIQSSIFSGVKTSITGKNQLKEVLGFLPFNYPKPIELIKRILEITSDSDSFVLDFFAGSGTTGHAVAQLNKEDGGNRKYILCTNNENNICEEVTYKRLANIQEELPHNLKYFKTDFVDKTEFSGLALEDELLNYVTPLVELQFAVDITNPRVQVILSEEQLDSLTEDDFVPHSTLFLHPDVFLNESHSQWIRKNQIKIQEIPDYFFGRELWQ